MNGERSKANKSGGKQKQTTFRIGKVRGDLRGRVWCLTYFEHGQRRRPRVGPDREAAALCVMSATASAVLATRYAIRSPLMEERGLTH